MSRLAAEDLKGVSETLLIPLHYRVEESRSDTGSFKDAAAERFHDAIAYDWEKFQGGAFRRLSIAARTRILDREVGAFLAAHSSGLVVNLGAGLDTRFNRLDNGAVGWIEIDLPGVIAFRKRLGEPFNPRHVLLAASVLEEGWVAEVKARRRPRILFVAEGLFPYFTEAEHRAIFARLADNFPGQELLFQNSAASVLRAFAQLSDPGKLRPMTEMMQWGLENGADVAQLDPRGRFVAEYPLLEGREDLAPEAVRRQFPPDKIRKAVSIVHVSFAYGDRTPTPT